MDLDQLRQIIERRDRAGADAARQHAARFSMDLASMYWRAADWGEKSMIIAIMQDQRGAHLRGMMRDFLRAVPPDGSWREHFDHCKAASLAALKNDESLFQVYMSDPGRLRRDVEAEVGPLQSGGAPMGPAPHAEPGGGNGNMMLLVGGGCGCLLLLILAGIFGFMMIPGGSDNSLPPTAPVAPPTLPTPTTQPVVPPAQPVVPLTPSVVPSTPAPSVPTPTAPSTQSAPSVTAPSNVSLEHIRSGHIRNGAAIWLIDYRNTGSTPIARPRVDVSMFDASGARVGERPGFGKVQVLQPGERTTILVLQTDPPQFARFEVTVSQRRTYRMPIDIPLAITEHTVQPQSPGRRQIIGTVQNTTGSAARFAQILVVGRNAAGEPVSFAYSYASTRDLPAGGSSGFNVRMGTFELEEPTTFDITAAGRP